MRSFPLRTFVSPHPSFTVTCCQKNPPSPTLRTDALRSSNVQPSRRPAMNGFVNPNRWVVQNIDIIGYGNQRRGGL